MPMAAKIYKTLTSQHSVGTLKKFESEKCERINLWGVAASSKGAGGENNTCSSCDFDM